MSLHRVTLVALATLFTAGMTSVAFAGCCEWGTPAPVFYASSGCGGCGATFAPITYAPVQTVQVAASGCGGCGAPAPMSYAEPAYAEPAYAEPAPQPLPVATWGTGCGCGRSVVYMTPAVQEAPIAPAPIYVADQGPYYSGPGVTIRYRTYSPVVAAAVDYPYVSGRYGYGRSAYGRPYYAHGPRYAYRERGYGYGRPHYMPHWRSYPRYPLGVRD